MLGPLDSNNSSGFPPQPRLRDRLHGLALESVIVPFMKPSLRVGPVVAFLR